MSAHHIGFYLSAMGDTPNHPDRYEIRLRGRLDARWAARFAGMALGTTGDGITVIEGPVADQAALYGLLGTLRDIGLPLLSVRCSSEED
jgi:hypothetical protein